MDNALLLISSLFVGTLLFGLALIYAISHFTKSNAAAADLLYRRTDILTPTEVSFFHVLEGLFPQYYIFAQVRLANIVKLDEKAFLWRLFNPLGAKCVDFVLCDKSTVRTLLVVELDDTSHNRADRKRRDAFVDQTLQSAGISILHVKVSHTYAPTALKAAIQEKLHNVS